MARYGAKQPVVSTIETIGEIKGIGIAIVAADPEPDEPQAPGRLAANIDRNRSMKIAVRWVEGVDLAMEKTEAADEHVIAGDL